MVPAAVLLEAYSAFYGYSTPSTRGAKGALKLMKRARYYFLKPYDGKEGAVITTDTIEAASIKGG